jgi:hypothetical protein
MASRRNEGAFTGPVPLFRIGRFASDGRWCRMLQAPVRGDRSAGTATRLGFCALLGNRPVVTNPNALLPALTTIVKFLRNPHISADGAITINVCGGYPLYA